MVVIYSGGWGGWGGWECWRCFLGDIGGVRVVLVLFISRNFRRVVVEIRDRGYRVYGGDVI